MQPFEVKVHVFAAPAIAFEEMDIGKLDLFKIELQGLDRVRFLGDLVRIGEVVYEKLVVPNRIGALQFDGGVFEPDVL